MTEWRETTLGDVLTLQRGFDLPARDRIDGPYPIVSSSGITGHHAVAKVEPPGVVIGRYGSLGSVHWLTEPYWPHNTALWVKDFKGNDPRFTSYLLRTISHDGSAAAAVPGVNRNHLHALPVRVPDVRVQRRIAAVLAAFDELIAINERRIELLEDLARSLYREWFVRRVAHDETLPATIADVAEPVRGTVSPLKHPQVDFEHFSIPAFDAGRLPVHEIGAAIKSSKTKLDGECVLLSKLNPRIPRVWLAVPTSDSPVASTEFLAWRGRLVSNAWLWATFDEDNFRRRMAGSAGGTSTSHQRVKPADVATYPIPRASADEMQTFDALAKPALRQATELRRANSALARTRGLLLPRLVTGRLDISDVDLGDLLPEEITA